ncbi:LANO_0F06678g1_1 [Lachancea nothofagi CBS 11611]|uniref:LANO_0F06678g1_1 n=1 Tax=Lachancea nothofagi CBS 11611 TaxID=1266666 RepID=A0A1G4K8P6_9SACH|nr:LANO_0F06678g1_1 [Lachancea nothofagi CBS 11611]
MSENSGISTSNGTRSSSQSSARSSRGSSSVETSVTKLLMSTKHLLQRLTQWSKGQANEKNVSDAYVQLGNDFKLVTKQFSHAGLEVSDLGDLPSSLRQVLEVALRERPSEETLDKYLPSIREIVVTLLDKLKVKQTLLKSMKQSQPYVPSRSSRSASSLSATSGRSTPTQREIVSAANSTNTSPYRSPAATSTPTKLELPPSIKVPKQRENQNAALAQLKKSDTLQRRASKRFSAYHMAKLSHQSTSEAAAMVTPPHSVGQLAGTNEVATPSESTINRTVGSTFVPSRNSSLPLENQEMSITAFLKLDDKVKKCSLALPTSFNSLRLLFVEKFTYTPGSNSFPEIYVKDPGYEAFYELEASHLDKIKDGSVVSLQSSDVNSIIPETDLVMLFDNFEKRFQLKQEALLLEVQKLRDSSSSPELREPQLQTMNTSSASRAEVEALRHQFAVLHQIHSAKKKSFDVNISNILEKVAKFKSLSFNSSTTANRVYMEKSHTKLSEVSDKLLSKVDDLQDVIEALRKDVAIRGSRPSKKKLETVHLELRQALDGLNTMQDYISIEKPNWKKIWESELEKVCEEQQFLTLQEDLAFDFSQDLEKVRETFDLVKLCCEEKEKNPKKTNNPILPIAKPGTFNQLRDAVLSEVEALHPDHDERVEAIERAAKLRNREKGYRDNSEFEDELGNFVGKNNFKKAGGIDEVDKVRQKKDEENLRANFRQIPS